MEKTEKEFEKSKVIVRNFRIEDLSKVIKIAEETLTERYSIDIYYDIYNSWPKGFIVAELNNEVIGFLASMRLSLFEARILIFSVNPSYQNKGVGSLLLKKFEDLCREERIKGIRLEARISNSNAIQFYEKRGFIIMSILRGYYSNGESAYVMWKMVG